MTVAELIKVLSKLPEDCQVCIIQDTRSPDLVRVARVTEYEVVARARGYDFNYGETATDNVVVLKEAM